MNSRQARRLAFAVLLVGVLVSTYIQDLAETHDRVTEQRIKFFDELAIAAAPRKEKE